jgi:hypothetical protein
MIPLASDLLPFPGQMQREDHLKSASLPDRAFFIWPQHNAVLNSRKCPEVIVVPVEKIARCCKGVTERAIAQKIDDLKVHAPPREEGGTATKV